MDPLTQGALGAALPQATRSKLHVGIAGGLGFLAGMTADLDVLIRSEADPLLFLEYHRQFTHALIFIPVGGLLWRAGTPLDTGATLAPDVRADLSILRAGLRHARPAGYGHVLRHDAVLAVQR